MFLGLFLTAAYIRRVRSREVIVSRDEVTALARFVSTPALRDLVCICVLHLIYIYGTQNRAIIFSIVIGYADYRFNIKTDRANNAAASSRRTGNYFAIEAGESRIFPLGNKRFKSWGVILRDYYARIFLHLSTIDLDLMILSEKSGNNCKSYDMDSAFQQNVVEPMQVDAPTEDNDNAEEEPYIVENPTLVRAHKIHLSFRKFSYICQPLI